MPFVRKAKTVAPAKQLALFRELLSGDKLEPMNLA